ncbi:MAG: 50S ribosomal protein L10 [Patescibacteria group bacterium]
MPKTKIKKQEILKSLEEQIAQAKSVVFVNFSGIPVKEIDALRSKGKEQKISYTVTKKTLLKRVLKEGGYKIEADNDFSGELAAVLGLEDEVAPAKLVNDFAKSNDKLKIIGGILEHNLIGSDKIVALAKLPSKKELLARAVGSLAAPLSGLVNVLEGNLRGLIYALGAIKDKKSA